MKEEEFQKKVLNKFEGIEKRLKNIEEKLNNLENMMNTMYDVVSEDYEDEESSEMEREGNFVGIPSQHKNIKGYI